MQDKIEAIIKKDLQEKNTAIGNDIVFLPDFKHTWNGPFRDKVYSEEEIKYCEMFDEPVLRYASTWAAKEAVYKAVKQLDNALMGPRSIEIIRKTPAGEPRVRLLKHDGKFNISLSITHDGDYVWAAALVKIKGRQNG